MGGRSSMMRVSRPRESGRQWLEAEKKVDSMWVTLNDGWYSSFSLQAIFP